MARDGSRSKWLRSARSTGFVMSLMKLFPGILAVVEHTKGRIDDGGSEYFLIHNIMYSAANLSSTNSIPQWLKLPFPS
jgi:hypothetical protein